MMGRMGFLHSASVPALAWSSTDKANDLLLYDSNITVRENTGTGGGVRTNIGVTADGVYTWSLTARGVSANSPHIGISNAVDSVANGTELGDNTNSLAYWASGHVYTNGGDVDTPASYADGDVIGVRLTISSSGTSKTIEFKKNNGAYGSPIDISTMTGALYPALSAGVAGAGATADFSYWTPRPAMAWSTWDKATSVNLSGSNLTAAGSSGLDAGARASRGMQADGAYTWTYTLTAVSGNSPYVGVGNTVADMNGLPSNSITLASTSGNVIFSGSTLAAAALPCTTGDVVGVRLIISSSGASKTVEFNKNGGTYTTAYDISTLAGATAYPIMFVGASGASVTAKFASAWASASLPANATLSADGLTATMTSSTLGNVRSNVGRMAAGKWYWEIKSVGNQIVQVGLLTGSLANTSSLFTTGGVCFVSNGSYALDGSSGAATPMWTTNDVLRLAWDAGSGLIWLSVNGGNWNGSGTANPATGVGGRAATPVTGGYPLYPASVMNVSGMSSVLNDGQSAFVYSVPPGYLSHV